MAPLLRSTPRCAILLGRALVGEGLSHGRAGLYALLLASAYGASDEYHQWFVPVRTADYLDWIADTGGAAIGGLCVASTRRAVAFWREFVARFAA